jgi:thiamine-monophosphate kinase
MSGAETDPERAAVDEFDQIARLFQPLTDGAPEALGLLDDAAVLQPPAGMSLVVTKDAVVEGVHFLPSDPLDLVARKLLRANLSDMAAMAAQPYAYFLAVAWPPAAGWPEREAFAAGLRHDQDAFGVRLLGGDTVSTPGPLTASLTLLGWAEPGRALLRSGAKPGDLVLASGTIGDGWLGLRAARDKLTWLGAEAVAALAARYRLPEPRLGLVGALAAHASAGADVSDGLLADAGHIAKASGVAMMLELERLPLSAPARAWLAAQPDRNAALADLATGGDDYEIVCTAEPRAAAALIGEARRIGLAMTVIGRVVEGGGVAASVDGAEVVVDRSGWKHG